MSEQPPVYSHAGHRYVLGYVADAYAIWDRNFPETPLQRFPRTAEGWEQAWRRFTGIEHAPVAMSGGSGLGGAPATWPAAPGPYPVMYAPRTNGLAVAALVLGIVWLYGIGSILALVFGYNATRQIDASNGRETGRGMAVAGIVLGWIGVGLVVLVILVSVTTYTSV